MHQAPASEPTPRPDAQPRRREPSLLAPFLALDKRIWLIALARLINTMGFSLVMPFLAMHLVEERGATGAAYGAIYLLSGVFSAVGQGVAGELSDRIGRRGVMVAGLASRTLNMVGLGLAVLYAAPLWVLGSLVVLNGFLRAQFEPAAGAAVTELSPPHLRVAAFGLQRIGVNLGWAVGPAMGGFLASHSYGTMFFVAAPATLVAILAVLPLGRHRPQPNGAPEPKVRLSVGQALESLREHRVFASYLVLVLFGSILTVQIFATLSVYASTQLALSKVDIGLLYTVNGVMVVAVQVPAVALARWWGMRKALVFGALLYAVGYGIFGFSSGFGHLAIGMAILTTGEVIFAPALSDTAATLADPERLGRAFGLFGLVQSLGLSLGPLVGGVAFDWLQHEPMGLWGAMAAGMVVLGIGYSAFGRLTGTFERMDAKLQMTQTS
jgi:MFS family permease